MTKEKGEKIDYHFNALEKDLSGLGDWESKHRSIKEGMAGLAEKVGDESAKRGVRGSSKTGSDR